jgi:hypothetical protein
MRLVLLSLAGQFADAVDFATLFNPLADVFRFDHGVIFCRGGLGTRGPIVGG